jgi:hypothetical protein
MDLAFLSPVLDRPGPWATVWVEATSDTPDAARQRELTARGVRERLASQGADQATRGSVYDAMVSPPPPGTSRTRGGRYLLGTGGEVVCDVALAGPPVRSGEAWSALPRLAPLLDGLADETPCLVAYIDRTGADLEVQDGGTRRLGSRQGEESPARGTGRDAWSERHHQLKVANTWERTAEDIARFIEDTWPDSGAEILMLAGDARERHSVRDRLPAELAERTAETEHGGRAQGTHTALLRRDVAAVRAAFERDRTEQELARYHSGAADTATDLPSLVEAAREHRIETLFVHPRSGGTAREVWVGAEADQLAAHRNELRYLGETTPHAARADDALLRSCAGTGARVVVVPDAAQAPAGGLGALLRWA